MAEKCIRFLLPWRGRMPGQVDRNLDRGVMDALVSTRRAEWLEPVTAESQSNTPRRARRNG